MSKIKWLGEKFAEKLTKKFMECEIKINKSGPIYNHTEGYVLCVIHLLWHDSNQRIQDENGSRVA